eukprot:m.234385 g.234385  ORF g.234385 m.234385 type:complete len:89 (+) comp17087_c0_seq1:1088-1354(+)
MILLHLQVLLQRDGVEWQQSAADSVHVWRLMTLTESWQWQVKKVFQACPPTVDGDHFHSFLKRKAGKRLQHNEENKKKAKRKDKNPVG